MLWRLIYVRLFPTQHTYLAEAERSYFFGWFQYVLNVPNMLLLSNLKTKWFCYKFTPSRYLRVQDTNDWRYAGSRLNLNKDLLIKYIYLSLTTKRKKINSFFPNSTLGYVLRIFLILPILFLTILIKKVLVYTCRSFSSHTQFQINASTTANSILRPDKFFLHWYFWAKVMDGRSIFKQCK